MLVCFLMRSRELLAKGLNSTIKSIELDHSVTKASCRPPNFHYPRNPTKPERLKCTNRRKSLLEQPVSVYYAVAYTWRDACKQRKVCIDGIAVSVPENAAVALQKLHRHKILWESRLDLTTDQSTSNAGTQIALWLDAICIDQSNEIAKARVISETNSMWPLVGEQC